MPNAAFHRREAEHFLKLTLGSADPAVAARYNTMMLKCLAKAEQLEPSPDQIGRLARPEGRKDTIDRQSDASRAGRRIISGETV